MEIVYVVCRSIQVSIFENNNKKRKKKSFVKSKLVNSLKSNYTCIDPFNAIQEL